MRRWPVKLAIGCAIPGLLAGEAQADVLIIGVGAEETQMALPNGRSVPMSRFTVEVRNNDRVPSSRFELRSYVLRGERRMKVTTFPQDLGPGATARVELANGHYLGGDRAGCIVAEPSQ